MATNMKSVKLRIKSVQNTMQITKAMELVASSKLRKAKDRADNTRPYFRELYHTLEEIAVGNNDFSSIFTKKSSTERSCYVVIAGDRGLAGGYNTNLFKLVEKETKGKDFIVLPIGKKAVEYYKRRNIPILTTEFTYVADISVADCFEMANLLSTEFRRKQFGNVHICYTAFNSMLSQSPEVKSLLPLTELQSERNEKKQVSQIIYEPDAESVFDSIVPEYLSGVIYGGICESTASELAARRNAMESATSNAKDMIEELNLYYNRARQSSITQEITEIVGGAESI